MSDVPVLDQNINKGRHHEFIKNTINDHFKDATVGRGRALAASGLKIEPWYTTSPTSHHDKLKAANLKAWSSQNKVDRLFEKLDLHSFAAPLLQVELKKRYGVEHDVKTTYVRLYLPKDLPWYVIDMTGGVTTRTVSMLDAALHNFAKSEKVDIGSDFITEPDHRGHFDILSIKRKMTVSQFRALCRELDIGAQYKTHLESFLLPGEPVAEALLRQTVTESQKDALAVAAQLALMTGDIQYDAYTLMLALAKDEPLPLLNGKQMQCCDFSMMGTRMTGIVLLLPVMRDSRGIQRLIAYVPHDPDHPLKEYPSTGAFMMELARQMRENKVGASSGQNYRQFFSQFVDQQQRGHFFANLDRGLTTLKWHDKEDRTDQRPAWREEPSPHPRLQFQSLPVPGDYWTYAFEQKLNKVLNDAREIAVSTADTDTKSRWVWWDNFKKIVSDLFNIALLIATPFVPGLGELMMAYTAYQLTNDVIEGIVDLAEGLAVEAAEQVISVVTDVIQLAAFGAGAAIGSTLRFKWSALVEGMHPVTLPNGKQSLWHADLKPYEQASLNLPAESKPDALGLHRHLNQDILPLEGKLYAVETTAHDPSATHRLKHPSRPNAYAPKLEHNGNGAWTHEAENPRTWEGPILMQRLGHSVDGISAPALEQIRIVSGTEADSLRRMHVENTPPPPLLADTLTRFKAYDDVVQAREQILMGGPMDPASYWFEQLVTELPGWPADSALKVYQTSDPTGAFRTYGNASAPDNRTLTVNLTDVMAGKLPGRIVDFLDAPALEHLLGSDVAKTEHIQALRNRLADATRQKTPAIFDHRYRLRSASRNPEARLLQSQYPQLPARVAETLLTRASQAELEVLKRERRIPLTLKNQVRECAFEASTSRAYAGFYQEALMGADTERLALNALRIHSDTYQDLRIEIRDDADGTPLRCAVGPDDAGTVRVLIRNEHGRYQVRDAVHQTLHEAGDFYESILRALPADKRSALGYQSGQGRLLKEWLMAKTQPPAERRTALAEPPIRKTVDRDIDVLLRGPGFSKNAVTLEDQAQNLYPHFNEREMNTFLASLRTKDEPHTVIEQLENELDELRVTLNRWRFEQPEAWGSERDGFKYGGGQFIADRLVLCFERKATVFNERSVRLDDGYTLNLSPFWENSPVSLGIWWEKLPDLRKYFEQITTLNLDETHFRPDSIDLLNDFTHLRQLSARRVGLNSLPHSIGAMQRLETLRLSDNKITLTPTAVEHLKNLTRLETLRLDDNPLGMAPNVERMPKLKVLSLVSTGIAEWPGGLFSKRRPRGFFLDLRENTLTKIPVAVAGSEDAFLIARTRLDTKRLSDANRIAYEDYRKSVGLSPRQNYSALAVNAREKWPVDNDSIRWDDEALAGVGIFREEAWSDLAKEPGAEGFFMVLDQLTTSADYRAGGDLRQQLAHRVWRMIDAVDLDPRLREDLFTMATAPTTCADAGAQLFNNMGVKVLASEAYSFSTYSVPLQNKLVTLAKGAARLERVNDIARADLANRTGDPDEVEVHLAYETGLAQRLDLPWQSRRMLYRPVAGVSNSTIEQAFDTIVSMEQGDGLVNAMIEQPFWKNYLQETHPNEFNDNALLFEGKSDLLDNLRKVQKTWANSAGLPEAQKLALRNNLKELAHQLPTLESVVFTGEEMTDEVYDRLYSDIGYDEQELSRRLTRVALTRAGL